MLCESSVVFLLQHSQLINYLSAGTCYTSFLLSIASCTSTKILLHEPVEFVTKVRFKLSLKYCCYYDYSFVRKVLLDNLTALACLSSWLELFLFVVAMIYKAVGQHIKLQETCCECHHNIPRSSTKH